MGIGLRVNQLNVDPHLIGRSLHATLKYVCYPKLLRDLTEIARFALIKLGGRARNNLQIRDASQTRQNFFLNPIRKIGAIWIATWFSSGSTAMLFSGTAGSTLPRSLRKNHIVAAPRGDRQRLLLSTLDYGVTSVPAA